LLPLLRPGYPAGTESRAPARRARALQLVGAARAGARRSHACAEQSTPIDPRYLMPISETLPRDAIVVDEALTSSASLPAFLQLRDPGAIAPASGGPVSACLAR
jgi:hypothetical protein